MDMPTIAPIIIICMLVCQGVKATPCPNKFLPIISGCVGGLLGLFAMHFMPDYPSQDILTSFALGVSSGFAATGINQAYKQITKEE